MGDDLQNSLGALITVLVVVGIITGGCAGNTDRYPEPTSPEDALQEFSVDDRFTVELFAAEPLVVDPVELVFDEEGRAYAVEMRDYPYEGTPDEPRSRIRLLEDVDRDGRVDESTVFAESLPNATSVLPWKEGILAVAPPEILYLRDTDGDNKADHREVLFTGFFHGDSQSQITNLRFNFDNWIYAANSGRPGKVTYTRRPERPAVDVEGGDFRFRLDRGEFGRISGSTQFGHDFDDWGRRYVTHNTLHIRQIVIPGDYLDRVPHFSPSQGRTNISDHGLRMYQQSDPEYWRKVRTERRNREYAARNLDRTEHGSGYFSAATGGTIYSGGIFPDSYAGNWYVGEVMGNLVHRDVLRSNGSRSVASRAANEQDDEFLTSTDNWFRPVNMTEGPDGALYVVDMYRQHIEMREFVPDDLEEGMDFHAGDDMGRIYRIVPKDRSGSYAWPDLGNASTKELVELLAHENRWWRLTAQRLILERQDRSITGRLEEMARSHARPQARLHAIYALEGLSALSGELVGRKLEDPHPGVREHAVRLAERYESLADEVAPMVDDPSARVAFQVALSLGEFTGAQVEAALAELARRRGDDRWIQTAILSSEMGTSVEMLEGLADNGFFDVPHQGRKQFLRRLSEVIASRRNRSEIELALTLLNELGASGGEAWQTAGLGGLAEGLEAEEGDQTVTLNQTQALDAFLNSSSDTVRAAAQNVARRLNM